MKSKMSYVNCMRYIHWMQKKRLVEIHEEFDHNKIRKTEIIKLTQDGSWFCKRLMMNQEPTLDIHNYPKTDKLKIKSA